MFGRLDPAVAHSLIGEGAILIASRGETVCRQDEPAAFYYIVLSGLIKLYRRAADGSIAIISIHGPAHSFMEAEALTGAHYSTTAEAVVDARIARIDAGELLLRNSPWIPGWRWRCWDRRRCICACCWSRSRS